MSKNTKRRPSKEHVAASPFNASWIEEGCTLYIKEGSFRDGDIVAFRLKSGAVCAAYLWRGKAAKHGREFQYVSRTGKQETKWYGHEYGMIQPLGVVIDQRPNYGWTHTIDSAGFKRALDAFVNAKVGASDEANDELDELDEEMTDTTLDDLQERVAELRASLEHETKYPLSEYLRAEISKTQHASLRERKIQERGGFCQCCGETIRSMLTLDHIKPRAAGGTSEAHNLQILCLGCNDAKGRGECCPHEMIVRELIWQNLPSCKFAEGAEVA